MNIALHRRVLLSLLQKIYKHADLAPMLGFKGGTSLYFLHQLNRFSVDLDFNLIKSEDRFSMDVLQPLLEEELTLNDVYEKENTWFWNGVYEPGQWNLKVEISKRIFDDEYEQKALFGLSLQTLKLECQLSHKLCAVVDRSILVNRDIFDIHFLLKKHVSIHETIIKQRTGKAVPEYLKILLKFIPENVSKRGVLDGLGELIDPSVKRWVQHHLLDETLFLLESRLEEY